MVPAVEHTPCVVLEATAVACMVSVSVALGALPGPPLVITMV
jgi:hypothetical protein